MGGAFTFTVVVIGVLVLGTYLLQGAILLLQVAFWGALLAARVAACILGALVWCGWWLIDRREATAALHRAEATQVR